MRMNRPMPRNITERLKLQGEYPPLRRPMGIAQASDRRAAPSEEFDLHLYERYLALRKAGRIDSLLAEGGALYFAGGPCNVWAGKRRVTVANLRALIEELEAAQPERIALSA